jgi:hypothetical protein
MTLFARLDRWWLDRNAKKSELDRLEVHMQQYEDHFSRVEKLESQMQIPPQIAKDMAILKQQMDRLELYVGLKREPQAMHVQGTAKIG